MALMYRRSAKRRYRRRPRRYTAGMKTNAYGSKSSGQLAVYRNAFSTATTNPKIPDGKSYHSSGVRLQAVKEFINDTDTTMDFLLFPGINNGIIMAKANQTNGRYMPYPSHFTTTPGGGGGFIQNADTAIDKWRVVSQALKITLINNSDENDGWWEACRVQLPSDNSVFQIVDGATANVVGTAFDADQLPGVDVERQMVENPTYVTGKLRDIHRHIFQLAPQGSDHDFNELNTLLSTTDSGGSIIDKNFDAIYIRIHGRTGTESPTRVMLHVVSNQELVYDEAATLCRYHSESVFAPSFPAAKRSIIQASPKAAKRSKYSTS